MKNSEFLFENEYSSQVGSKLHFLLLIFVPIEVSHIDFHPLLTCYLDALLPGDPGVLALCGVRRAPLEAEPGLPCRHLPRD